MPSAGHTNLVVHNDAGDALRRYARQLSADLGRRVTLTEALADAVHRADTTRAAAALATPRRRGRPARASG